MVSRYNPELRLNVFVDGNAKMGPYVPSFNLPAVETCLPSQDCMSFCYAQRGQFLAPSTMISGGLLLAL